MGDFRIALRRLRRTPVVSAAILLSLSLGVGVTTAVFSVVNGLLLRPLPVRDPDGLVTLSSNLALQHGLPTGLGWNHAIWLRLQERAASFDGALAWVTGDIALGSGRDRATLHGLFTSGTFFTMLGVQARAGRLYNLSDDRQGGGADGPVAVISDRFWDRRFGRDPRAIGSLLALGEGVVTVVGVTPPDFDGLELGRVFDVAVPLAVEPGLRGKDSIVGSPNQFLLTFMLRLKPGQSLQAAEHAIQAVQPDLIASMRVPKNVELPIRLVPAANGADRHRLRWSYQQPVLAIFIAALLTLLVACANIANLVLARAGARAHELSVRLALGASRTRLAAHLLTECLVLVSAGTLIGLLVAWWAIQSISAFVAASWSIDAGPSLDWRVLWFAAIMAGTTIVLFGSAPAVLAFRSAPAEVLKAHDRRIGGGRFRASGLFVTAQVALSMVLIVLTGLFVGSFGRLVRLPLGFVADRLLIADVKTERPQRALDRIALQERLVEAALSAPGVASAAASRLTPLSAASNSLWAEQKDVDLRNAITPGWFATYGIPIHTGRDFDRRDTADAQPVAIVTDAYRRKHFADRNPVGEVVDKRTIVGVVGDSVFSTVRAGPRPTIYEPLAQLSGESRDTGVSIAVRPASAAPADLARDIRAALAAADGNATVTVRLLSEDVAASIAQERLLAGMSGLFALLAVTLAGLGVYGLMSHVATERRREIAVRLALGASTSNIVRLILRRAVFLIVLGVVLGTLGGMWVSEVAGSLLYGLGPRDVATFAAAAAVLLALGLVAAWVPARKAARAHPAETLRLG